MAKILVIDDEEQIRRMLRRILEREGYEVLEAEEGNSGIAIARETPMDLIITDIVMPEKEGIETIRELKKENPDLKIIAMSGGGRIKPESYLKLAESFGVEFTFTKPIHKNDLLEAIRSLIGRPQPS